MNNNDEQEQANEKYQSQASNMRDNDSKESPSESASLVTAQNSIVDVFEFEPVGFMSKGRW